MQRRCNHFEDTVNIATHFVIPEPQNTIIMCGKPIVAVPISCIVRMLSTIHFHDQPSLPAHEVHDIAPYWFLPHEFAPDERARPQLIPETLFSFG